MNWTTNIAPAPLLILIGLLFHLMPSWQRPGLFFAIRVPAGFSETGEAKSLVRIYRAGIWILTLLSVLAAAMALQAGTPRLLSFVVLGQTAGAMALYARTRSQARPWADPAPPVRRASLASQPVNLPINWIVHVLPLLVLAGAAAYLRTHYDSLPDPFPIHYGLYGQANRWAAKSHRGVYGALVMGVFLQALFLFLSYAMTRGTRGAVPGSARMRSLKVNLWILLFVQWIVALLISGVAVQPLLPQVFPFPPVLIISALLVVGLIGSLIYLGKLNRDPGGGPGNTPDECWRVGGRIYYNPDDPVLMVEKRMGLGYTINFGNRLAWVLIAFTLACLLVPVWLFR
jgi:uncharacterized membrane protein